MAIIRSSDIKTTAELSNLITDYNMELDLEKKELVALQNFPTVVVGDNNSTVIKIKVPFEHLGVDLFGTNCIISYDTSWTDDNGNYSSGQIDLTDTCEEKEDYLLYTWVLDIKQTAKAGGCNFAINFLMNLEADPFLNNTDISIEASNNTESLVVNGINETQLKYWSMSSLPYNFNINDKKLGFDSDFNLVLPTNLENKITTIENK